MKYKTFGTTWDCKPTVSKRPIAFCHKSDVFLAEDVTTYFADHDMSKPLARHVDYDKGHGQV